MRADFIAADDDIHLIHANSPTVSPLDIFRVRPPSWACGMTVIADFTHKHFVFPSILV